MVLLLRKIRPVYTLTLRKKEKVRNSCARWVEDDKGASKFEPESYRVRLGMLLLLMMMRRRTRRTRRTRRRRVMMMRMIMLMTTSTSVVIMTTSTPTPRCRAGSSTFARGPTRGGSSCGRSSCRRTRIRSVAEFLLIYFILFYFKSGRMQALGQSTPARLGSDPPPRFDRGYFGPGGAQLIICYLRFIRSPTSSLFWSM
jgi:hypothetical protein